MKYLKHYYKSSYPNLTKFEFKINVLLLFYIFFAKVILQTRSATTCDRITQHGYPCETHSVQTDDGYILTLFRIPLHTHRFATNANQPCVVLIMHGLFGSSDTAALNGPRSGLIFMLADIGCDVWLGNARGKRYSQRHVNKSSWLPSYWDFSWHEIGIIDIPAKIDYILATTGQDSIHYVGHSQGGTCFLVMLSMRTKYNTKIRTSHLFAPAVFMEHTKSSLFQLMGDILGHPSSLATTLSSIKLGLPSICRWGMLKGICDGIIQLAMSDWSRHMNMTLLPLFYETHPDDCSLRQLIHFMQVWRQLNFSAFDYGSNHLNMAKYGTTTPPDYILQNIKTKNPIHIYYADNDDWVAVRDIEKLLRILGAKAKPHHINLTEFNHYDFMFAENVKDVINDCVLDVITGVDDSVKCNYETNAA